MADVLFSDGLQQVDDLYVPLLNEATDGEPQKFTYKAAMQRLGRVLERGIVRNAMSNAIRGHFRQWGR